MNTKIPEDYEGKLEREAKREIKTTIAENWSLFETYSNLDNYHEELNSFINFLYELKHYYSNDKIEKKLVLNSRIDNERDVKTSKNQKLYSNLFKITLEKDTRNFFTIFLEKMGYKNIEFDINHQLFTSLNSKFLNTITLLFKDLENFKDELKKLNYKSNCIEFMNTDSYCLLKYKKACIKFKNKKKLHCLYKNKFIKYLEEKKFKEEILLKNFFLYIYKKVITMDFSFYLDIMKEVDLSSSNSSQEFNFFSYKKFIAHLKECDSISLKSLKKIFLMNQNIKKEISFEDKLSLVCLYWISAENYIEKIEVNYFEQIFYEIKTKKEITIHNNKIFKKNLYEIYLVYIAFYYSNINSLNKKIESYIKIFYTNFLYEKLGPEFLSYNPKNNVEFHQNVIQLNKYYLRYFVKNKVSFSDLEKKFQTNKIKILEILEKNLPEFSIKISPEFSIKILEILSDNLIDFSSPVKKKSDSERNLFNNLFFLLLIMYKELSKDFHDEIIITIAYLLDFYQNSYLISNEKGEYHSNPFPLETEKFIQFFIIKNTDPQDYEYSRNYFRAAIFSVNYYKYLLKMYS